MLHTARFTLVLLFAASMSGCGGGGSGGNEGPAPVPSPTPTPTPAPPPARSVLPWQPATEYSRLLQVPLADVDSELAAATGIQVRQTSGPLFDFKLGPDGVLRALAPPQQAEDSSSVIEFSSQTRKWVLTLPWTTHQQVPLVRVEEATESGAPAQADGVGLTTVGLIDNFIVTSAMPPLELKVTGAPPLSPTATRITLNSATSNISIADWFSFDAPTNTFTLLGSHVASFSAFVRDNEDASMGMSFGTPRYKNTYVFDQRLVFAQGQVTLNVVNASGQPATGLMGATFVLRGFNTGFTRRVKLSADASGVFSNLPADSYEVTQTLLEPGAPLSGFTVLPTASSAVTLVIKLTAAPNAQRAAATHSASATAFDSSSCQDTDIHQDAAIDVFAGGAGNMKTQTLSYCVRRGTKNLKARFVVTSDWASIDDGRHVVSYRLTLPGPSPSLSWRGNLSEFSRWSASQPVVNGASVVDQCIDVSKATADGPLPITMEVGAMLGGDFGFLASSLRVTADACPRIMITSFIGEEKTLANEFLLYPKNATVSNPKGNLAGRYLSIPRAATLPPKFGIPAVLRFTPAVKATEVELFLRLGSNDISIGKGYLDQALSNTAGQVTFPTLRLDPRVFTPTSERVQVLAVVRGTVDDAASESLPFPLAVGAYNNFTPLYLSSDMAGYSSARRFGQGVQDPGGDSWGTLGMVNWLFTTKLVYNDTSAANVLQMKIIENGVTKYKSVLGHAGHSDGQQADLRYWDGAGGFTEPLNGVNDGAHILALAEAAKAEVDADVSPKPKLAQLVAWITQNRTQLNSFAARGEVRKIYVGDGFFWELLKDGKFPDTDTTIPGVTPTDWAASAKVSKYAEHRHHWHVSTRQ